MLTLDEAGVRQTIGSLSPAADEPLTAGLLVDASASQMQSQERVRRAGNTFREKLLRAGNQALVVRFDPNLELIQGLTASRAGLEAALQMVLASSEHFGGSAVLPRAMNLSRLSPPIASVGDVVTASGDDLGNSEVIAVYVTDGKHTFETQALEQTENTIKFKVPEGTQSGPWIEGETRPHFWNLMLHTTDGELLHYIGFEDRHPIAGADLGETKTGEKTNCLSHFYGMGFTATTCLPPAWTVT